MGFKEAVRTCMKDKFFTFQGRAARSEYWYAYLFMVLVWVAIVALFLGLGGLQSFDVGGASTLIYIFAGIAILTFFYLLWAMTSALVRRFHDRNLSGWWVLAGMILGAVPYVGILVSIAMLVITVLKGTDGDNRFGPDPLREQNSADVFA